MPALRSRFHPVLTTVVGAALVLAAAGVPSNAADVAVPPALAPKLEAFRKVAWSELLKPVRGDPAPASWRTRCETEWAFASLDAASSPSLLPLLADPDRFVRALAARSIGIAQPAGATPALVAALATEKDKVVRVALVEALGRTGGDGALAAVEAQQVAGADADVSLHVGFARRQLKGGAWDLASIRGENAEAQRAKLDSAKPGEPAPEISLPQPGGPPLNLSTLKGRIVILAFVHGDRGGPDWRAIQRLTMEQTKLDAWNVAVVVVDPHEKERTKAWADKQKLPWTFVSDPAGRAAAVYGAARQLFIGGEWLPSPCWCVIDREGRLAWRKLGTRPEEQGTLGDLLPVLENVSRNIKTW